MEREIIRKLESVESVEKLIEALFEWHKAGEITSMMTVFFDKEGNVSTHWTKIPTFTRAIGALERLKFAIMLDSEDL